MSKVFGKVFCFLVNVSSRILGWPSRSWSSSFPLAVWDASHIIQTWPYSTCAFLANNFMHFSYICMGKRESAVRKKAPSSHSSQNKSAEAPFQLLAALVCKEGGGIDKKGWYHMALALSVNGWREGFFFGLTDCSQFISLSLLLRSFLPMPYQKKKKKKKKALFAVSLRLATCLSPHTLDKKTPTYWIRIRISNEAKLSGAVIRDRCCRLPCKKKPKQLCPTRYLS